MILVSAVNKKSKDECTAHFSNGMVMNFTAEELCAFHIKEGREFEEPKFEQVISKVWTERAKAKVMSSVLYSPKTSKQVKDKILKEGFNENVADKLVDELTEKGYIDDEAYAERFIKKAIKSKPNSVMKITADLRGKGISGEVISRAIKNLTPDEDEMALRALEKKLHQSRDKDYNKLYGFLSRKGFPSGAARKALEHFGIEKDNEY